MWGAIGKALNDTIIGGKIKPLNKIIQTESYNSFYNSMMAYVTAYGDGGGKIAVIPYGTTNISGFASNTNIKSVVFPPTAEMIDLDAFNGCSSLENVTFSRKIYSIRLNAFKNCTSIKSIYIPSNVKLIGATAFTGCTNLTDIYVEWSEGEVSNAPWGATNATIHYNSEA